MLDFHLGALVIAVAGGIIGKFAAGWGIAVAVFAAIFAISLIIGLVRRASTRYTITDFRLHIRRGILSRREQHTTIDRIQNVETHASRLLERLLRIGSVDFDTSATDESSFRFEGIATPKRIVAAVDAAQRRFAAGTPTNDGLASIICVSTPEAPRRAPRRFADLDGGQILLLGARRSGRGASAAVDGAPLAGGAARGTAGTRGAPGFVGSTTCWRSTRRQRGLPAPLAAPAPAIADFAEQFTRWPGATCSSWRPTTSYGSHTGAAIANELAIADRSRRCPRRVRRRAVVRERLRADAGQPGARGQPRPSTRSRLLGPGTSVAPTPRSLRGSATDAEHTRLEKLPSMIVLHIRGRRRAAPLLAQLRHSYRAAIACRHDGLAQIVSQPTLVICAPDDTLFPALADVVALIPARSSASMSSKGSAAALNRPQM